MSNLKRYVERARTAIGKGTKYGLGCGGMSPYNKGPADKNNRCDCSGFVAWVLGLSRKPKPTRNWWIETTMIHKDASKNRTVFIQISKAEPGCLVVFPDKDGREGHVGIVSAVNESGTAAMVIDCTSKGITEQGAEYFSRKGAIYCILKQDMVPKGP